MEEGQGEPSSQISPAVPIRIISPKKVSGLDACRPQSVPRITGWDGGINVNRMDLGNVPFNDVVLLSVFSHIKEADLVQFLLFVRGRKRAFITDAAKVHYTDFSGVKGETVLLSLRKFVIFLLERNPAIIVDGATERFIRGKKPQTLEKGVLDFVTALSQELEKHEPGFYTEEGKSGPAQKQDLLQEELQDKSHRELSSGLTSERMICPKCGMEQAKAEACRRCGVIIEKYLARTEKDQKDEAEKDAEISPKRRGLVLAMDFEGGVFSLFAMILLIYNPFLLPVGWALAFFTSWVCDNTTLSDGYSVRFMGRGEEIWWAPVMMIVPPALLGLIIAVLVPTMIFLGGDISGGKIFLFVILALAAILASLYYAYRILHWIIGSIEFSWSGRLFFNGPYWVFVGWIFSVVFVSGLVTLLFGWLGEMLHFRIPSVILLIISQAFIFGAFLFLFISWIFNYTTCSTNENLVWTGSVLDITWRSLVLWMTPMLFAFLVPHAHFILKLILLVLLIICYAFLIHWYFRWLIQKITIE